MLTVNVHFNGLNLKRKLKIMEKIPIWHILPINDSDTHIEMGDCKCKPKIEVLEDRVMIIHNSFDGREAVEWANEILNKSK